MRTKLASLAIIALAVSCGPPPSVQSKEDVVRVMSRSGATNPMSGRPARDVTQEINADCPDGGKVWLKAQSGTTGATDAQYNFQACAAGGYVINGQGSLKLTISSGSGMSVTYNGSMSITNTAKSTKDDFQFTSFTITVSTSGKKTTITANGTVNANGQVFTYANETFDPTTFAP